MENEWVANSDGLVRRSLAGRCHCSRDLKAESEAAGEGRSPDSEASLSLGSPSPGAHSAKARGSRHCGSSL